MQYQSKPLSFSLTATRVTTLSLKQTFVLEVIYKNTYSNCLSVATYQITLCDLVYKLVTLTMQAVVTLVAGKMKIKTSYVKLMRQINHKNVNIFQHEEVTITAFQTVLWGT